MPGLLPNVDPDGLLEYSVVFTDRGAQMDHRDLIAFMVALSRVLAGELGPFGITVNAVAPAMVGTERLLKKFQGMPEEARKQVFAGIPVGRWSEPEEVAAAIVFLCSEEAGYICGAVLDINGGSLLISRTPSPDSARASRRMEAMLREM